MTGPRPLPTDPRDRGDRPLPSSSAGRAHPARTSDPLDPTATAAIRTLAAGLTLIVCSLILAIVASIAGKPDPGTLLIAPPVTEVGP